MIPWELLDKSQTPDNNSELFLYKRGKEYSIRLNGMELMNSRIYRSESLLSRLSCKTILDRKNVRILIGGLGMGYTLASALSSLKSDAKIVIVELMPAVIKWNREILFHLAGSPLDDPRVTSKSMDIVQYIKENIKPFDAVILDVDNGPEGFTQKNNDWLYNDNGLKCLKKNITKNGNLSIWSAAPNKKFSMRLKKTGFKVEEKTVRAGTNKKGSKHTIWIAHNN